MSRFNVWRIEEQVKMVACPRNQRYPRPRSTRTGAFRFAERRIAVSAPTSSIASVAPREPSLISLISERRASAASERSTSSISAVARLALRSNLSLPGMR